MPIPIVLRAALVAGVVATGAAACTPQAAPTNAARAVDVASTPAGPSPAASPPPAARESPSPPPPPAPTPVVERGDGVLSVVPGAGPVSGPGAPTAYVVEVEGGLGVDARAFAREVDRVLTDPRSWGAGGRRAVRRVSGGDVVFRVTLASPTTADGLCAPLRTNGYFSCASGSRAVLNSARWLTGADAYGGGLADYRAYLVNHEVGHVLGRGHEPCPGTGRRAPVMLQQSKGLDGCVANSWPYP